MTHPQREFEEDYFRLRQGNDARRQASFRQERAYLAGWLGERIFAEGRMLDVGCSTGEFIEAVGWNIAGAYGMEISEYARRLAAQRGVRFDHDLTNAVSFFDLVIFRGTVQYLPRPFDYIEFTWRALKPEGHVVFLATPNTNSLFYRLFKTLPFLEEDVNYWVPCDSSLQMVLRNAGFRVLDVQFPYWRTPYAKPFRDHLKLLRKLFFRTNDMFAFWKSSMTVLAQKEPHSTDVNDS